MIVIETKTVRVFVNEKETTSVYFDKAERDVYINYLNVPPRKLQDVESITYTNEAHPAFYKFSEEEDTL